jgi:thymidylate kinase
VSVPVLVVVWGASPGIGKSTLCAGLAARLADAGHRVDHFREEEILTRPEFAEVAELFLATGTVQAAMLRTATQRLVASSLAEAYDVVIADALMPYVPSLLAMGDDDDAIDAFVADLTPVLAPLGPVMVFLDGDPGTALRRAADREDPGWLDDYLDKLAYYRVTPPVTDVASAVDYLRREREVTLSAVRRSGWAVEVIEGCDELTPADLLATAEARLRPRITAR